MISSSRNAAAVVLAPLLAFFCAVSEAATITGASSFILPGSSTGSLTPSLVAAPNNDNAVSASPNTISYSIFFNAGGLGPADLEFDLANSGGHNRVPGRAIRFWRS